MRSFCNGRHAPPSSAASASASQPSRQNRYGMCASAKVAVSEIPRRLLGTPEFDTGYQAAIAALPPARERQGLNATGTLAWLIERYRGDYRPGPRCHWRRAGSGENDLSTDDREVRRSMPIGKITKATIIAGRDRDAPPPAPGSAFPRYHARAFSDAAAAAVHRSKVDPTVGVNDPGQARPKSDIGFPPWSEDDVAAYHARWPIGTRERVWIDAFFIAYTGLRRGDAVRSGTAAYPQRYRHSQVTLPILGQYSPTLFAAGPCRI